MFQKKWSIYILCLVILCNFFLVNKYRWEGNTGKDWQYIIVNDAKGYYNYLPAIFIYKDLSKASPETHGIIQTKDGILNKYCIGESLLLSPFFAVAYIQATIKGNIIDGFSEPFEKWVSIAALFYLALGLFCLRNLLIQLQVSEKVTAAIILFIGLGTNLLYISVIEPAMSHVYSFSMIACFLYAVSLFFEKGKSRYLYMAAFLGTLIILIRPPNGFIAIMIPFFFPTDPIQRAAIISVFKKVKTWVITAGIAILMFSLQSAIWYAQVKKYFIWSYQGEGFYFLHPEIFNVLFSFKRGLFIYTPITFISLFGLIALWKKSKSRFYFMVLFLSVSIYLISSWWNWYYGVSLGHRAFIDFYAVFAILLGIFLSSIGQIQTKIFSYFLLICALSLNVFQTWQFYAGIIHPCNMSWEKYKYVFLKTEDKYVNCLGGVDDIFPYNKYSASLIGTFENDYENKNKNWETGNIKCEENSKNCYCVYDGTEFGTSFTLAGDSIVKNSNRIFLEGSLSRYETENNNSSGALFVIDVREKDGKPVYYYTCPINDLPSKTKKEWKTWQYGVDLSEVNLKHNNLKIYIWNKDLKKFFIDNFKLRFYKIAS